VPAERLLSEHQAEEVEVVVPRHCQGEAEAEEVVVVPRHYLGEAEAEEGEVAPHHCSETTLYLHTHLH